MSFLLPPSPISPRRSSLSSTTSSLPSSFPSLCDNQLYAYVLRSALWHDRISLVSGTPFHGGGPMTALARSLFAIPNDKSRDPAYATVKLKSHDKHLYRDLKLYLERLQLGLVSGRQPDDFPSRTEYETWLNVERDAIVSELRSLSTRDLKVTKKSKRRSPNPHSSSPLFIPPHPDDAFLTILRKTCTVFVHEPGAAGWPSPELVSLLDLLQTRWRINYAFRLVGTIERVIAIQFSIHELHTSLLNRPASFNNKVSDSKSAPHALHEMNSLLSLCLQEAHVSFSTWTTCQRNFTYCVIAKLASNAAVRLQYYSHYYSTVHFVVVMAAMSQILSKAHVLLQMIPSVPSDGKPDHLLSLNPVFLYRNASQVHFRQLVEKLNQDVKLDTKSTPATCIEPIHAANSSSLPCDRIDHIISLCSLVSHDLSKFERIRVESLPGAFNDKFKWSDIRVILAYELLLHLFTYIEEFMVQPDVNLPITRVFDLYNTLTRLASELHQTHAMAMKDNLLPHTPDPIEQLMRQYSVWFQDAVDDWIEQTSATMSEQWTHRIIAQDQFLAQEFSSDMQSTSVVDLYSAFHQEVDVIRSLSWPSLDQEYRATKKFTRTICDTLIRYADFIQGQMIAILLQMEEAALAEVATMELTPLTSSSSSISSSDDSKSLIHRLRGVLNINKEKDQSVAIKITRNIRPPVSFNEQLCVRMNNLYAAKRRINNLYCHLTSVLSQGLPNNHYTSPFVRDQTMLAMTEVYIEFDTYSNNSSMPNDMFWVEVQLDGNILGRTSAEKGILRKPGSDVMTPTLSSPIDPDSSILVPVTSEITVNLIVYASKINGESVLSAMCDSDSMVRTREEKLGLAKGGLVIGICTADVNVREVNSSKGVSKLYDVGLTGASQWALRHNINQRKLRVHVCWVPAESWYMYYHFEDVYSKLSVMIDNGLLMMANQISKWMQDYMLHLVKQYKIAVIARAFSNTSTEFLNSPSSTEIGSRAEAESTLVSFKTRAGRKTITFATVEADMQPLLDYLNRTLEVLNSHLHGILTTKLFKRVWKGALTAVEWQLTGRRNKDTGKWKQLDHAQIAVLRRALTLLYDFFYVDGEGLSRSILQSRNYHRLVALLSWYHTPPDDLMGMYQTSISMYLATKVDSMSNSSQLPSQETTLSRETLLSNFTKLVDVSNGGRNVDMTRYSPEFSNRDIQEVMVTLTRPVAPEIAPVNDPSEYLNTIRDAPLRRRFQTLKPFTRFKSISSKNYVPESNTNQLNIRLKSEKQRRFQHAAVINDDSESSVDKNDEIEDTNHSISNNNSCFTSIDGVDTSTSNQTNEHEIAQAQHEFRLASLARQEAIWTILCLRADIGDHECRDFVTDQAAAMRRVLDNMRNELHHSS